MKVIIARHGEAEATSSTGLDRDRHLTSKGREDIRKMAQFIQKTPLCVKYIYHSPYIRTKETAETFSEFLYGIEDVISDSCLEPMGEYHSLLPSLCTYTNSETVLIIGHNPEVSYFTASLVHDISLCKNFIFFPGTTIALNIARENFCRGQILWVISPEYL